MKSHLTKPHHLYNNLDLGHTPRSVRGHREDAHGFDISFGSLISVFQSKRRYTNQSRRIQR